MSSYEDILESYWERKCQVTEILSKELEEPIVIHSRVPNEPSFTVHSISSLHSLAPGVRLRVCNNEYMKISRSPGWVSWTGFFVDHSVVYREILSTTLSRGCLTISR